ncbi:hypothetical protein JW758_05155 [Candidatus Peregrinibacteria bacterium]|nr:hypothetical protein [Candidatus Peregrinibacteria bacterium]
MVTNPFSTLHITKKNRELAEKLQSEMDANFLEHTMYDINDVLTSILALCDMEQMKSIPKVKNYINRINELLNDVQIYQDEKNYNINHLLRNVIDMLMHNFKDKVKILTNFVPVKALAKSNQTRIERMLLYLFIELILTPDKLDNNIINVELFQKEKEAVVKIKRDDFHFSHEQIKEFTALAEDFIGSQIIEKKGNGVLITIKVPLSLKTAGIFNLPPTPTSTVKVTSAKSANRSIKSFAKD